METTTNYVAEFESIRATLREVAQMQKETQEMQTVHAIEMTEFRNGMAETKLAIDQLTRDIQGLWDLHAETEREIQKTQCEVQKTQCEVQKTQCEVQKTSCEVRKLRKTVDDLNKAFGRSIERITTPYLQDKFKTLGFEFDTQDRNVIFRDVHNQKIAEVDVFLENHNYAMAVEVKNNVQKKDITEHLTRLLTLRRNADIAGDSRKYLGAIAAPDIDSKTMTEICKAGFFVVRMSKNAVDVVVTEGFKPKEW